MFFYMLPASAALLVYCLGVSRDTRLRRKMYEDTRHLSPDALYAQFQLAMWVAGLYAARPRRPLVPLRDAEQALVLATVLREHIFIKAGHSPPRSYLRQRAVLIRQAKAYARAHWPIARP